MLLLGGDCSIVLGGLLGARRASNSRLGLVYVDGHADFATPEESVTGSAASMCAAFAIGRGDSALAQLADVPLVNGSDLAILGRRDDADGNIYGQAALHAAGALDIPALAVRSRGVAAAAAATLERLSGVSRIWIHVDADVLDPSVMPAVDSPEPSGLSVDELVSLASPVRARSPRRRIGVDDLRSEPGQPRHVRGNARQRARTDLCGARPMIARIWHGRVPASKSDAYYAYLLQTGVPEYAATPGNKGVQVLRKTEDGVTHFLLAHALGLRGRDQAVRR